MLSVTVDSLLTPATLLWVAASVVAVTLLFGSMNQRRAKLTETLKTFVQKTQPEKPDSKSSGENSDG